MKRFFISICIVSLALANAPTFDGDVMILNDNNFLEVAKKVDYHLVNFYRENDW